MLGAEGSCPIISRGDGSDFPSILPPGRKSGYLSHHELSKSSKVNERQREGGNKRRRRKGGGLVNKNVSKFDTAQYDAVLEQWI